MTFPKVLDLHYVHIIKMEKLVIWMGDSLKEVTKSSGNVFADMGLEDAEELLTRAKLGVAVRRILESRNLKQQEIVKLLDIKQPEVSNIMKGKYYLFSEARLFTFLNKLQK